MRESKGDLFPIQERAKDTAWFLKHANELSPEKQADFLEEAMRHETMKDREIIPFVRALPKQERARLGHYIVETIKPTAYLGAFYECWSSFSAEKQKALINICGKKHPEQSVLIAPFVDGEKITLETAKHLTGMKIRVPAFVVFAEDPAVAHRLIESLLNYYESHPEIQKNNSPTGFSSRDYLLPEQMAQTYIRDAIVDLQGVQHRPLLAFVDQLKRLDLPRFSLTETMRIRRLYTDDLAFTQEERTQMDALQKKHHWKKNDLLSLTVKPKSALRKYIAITDSAAGRQTAQLIRAHDMAHLNQEQRLELAQEFLEKDHALFSFVRDLHLSKADIRQLLYRNIEQGSPIGFNNREFHDLKTLLEWNRQTEPKSIDLEKVIVKYLVTEMKNEGDNSNDIRAFVERIDEVLPFFSESSQTLLLKTLVEKTPGLLIHHMGFANKKGVSFRRILTDAAKHSLYFDEQYHILLFHLRKQLQQGTADMTVKDFQEQYRAQFEQFPGNFFSPHAKKFIAELYPGAVFSDFIKRHLSEPIDRFFLERFLKSELFEDSIELCRSVFEKNPMFVVQLFEHMDAPLLERLCHLLSEKQVLNILIEQLEDVEFNIFFEKSHVLDRLVQYPLLWKSFLSKLKTQHRLHETIGFYHDFNAPERKMSDLEKDIKRTKQQLDGDRKSSESKEHDSEEIEKGKKKLAVLKENLKKLKLEIQSPRHKRALSAQAELKRMLIQACKEERFFVFQSDLFAHPDFSTESEVKEAFERELEEYAPRNPAFFWGSYRDPSPPLEKRVGEERYLALARKHLRRIAFSIPAHDLKSLPIHFDEEIVALNPLLVPWNEKDKQEKLPLDYYDLIIQSVKTFQYYPLYASALEKIAVSEQELYGKRLNLDGLVPNDRFEALINRVALLEASPLAQKYASTLMALPAADREPLLEQLEFLSLYQADEQLLLDDVIDDPLRMNQRLSTAVQEVAYQLFDLPKEIALKKGSLPIETLQALSIYYQTRCEKTHTLKPLFQDCITRVLNGTFYPWRRWGTDQEPETQEDREQALSELKKQQLLPTELTLKQYEAWNQDMEEPFSAVLALQLQDVREGVVQILDQAIVDEHVPKEALVQSLHELQSHSERLFVPLKEMTEEKALLDQRFADVRIKKKQKESFEPIREEEERQDQELKERIVAYRQEHSAEIQRVETLLALKGLQRLTLDEFREQKIPVVKGRAISFTVFFEQLESLFIPDHPAFATDIARIRKLLHDAHDQLFSGKTISRLSLVMTDRFDLDRAVRIGERPVATCQHYNKGSYNQGLLAYVTDPNVKILQIMDERQQIVARAVLRLLEDGDGKPQLFLERIYSANAHQKISEAILHLAKQKAHDMGTQLYALESPMALETQKEKPEETERYEFSRLISRGSRSAFVYTDAGGGARRKGVYEIANVREI